MSRKPRSLVNVLASLTDRQREKARMKRPPLLESRVVSHEEEANISRMRELAAKRRVELGLPNRNLVPEELMSEDENMNDERPIPERPVQMQTANEPSPISEVPPPSASIAINSTSEELSYMEKLALNQNCDEHEQAMLNIRGGDKKDRLVSHLTVLTNCIYFYFIANNKF